MEANNIHHAGPYNSVIAATTPPEPSSASSQPFPFLKLPLELRRRVYRCLLPDRVPAQWTRTHNALGLPSIDPPLKVNGDRSYPEILRLNHFVHAEAEDSLYDFAYFTIKLLPFWESLFLNKVVRIGRDYTSQLRKVKLITIDIALNFDSSLLPDGVYITRGETELSRNLKDNIHHLMNYLRKGNRLKCLTVDCYWPSTKRPSPLQRQNISVSLRWLLEPLRELRGLVRAEIKVLKGLPTEDARIDALEDEPEDTQLDKDNKRYLRKGLRNIERDVCGHTAVTTLPSLLEMWLSFVRWQRYRTADQTSRRQDLSNMVWSAHDHGDVERFMTTVDVLRTISKEAYDGCVVFEAEADRVYKKICKLGAKRKGGWFGGCYLPIGWKNNITEEVMFLIRVAWVSVVGMGVPMVVLRKEILGPYDERLERFSQGLWLGMLIYIFMVRYYIGI